MQLDDKAPNQGANQSVSQNGVQKWPGARSYNPLSELSSSTYNISLYITTSEVASRFIQSGGTMIGINPQTDPIYVVAQSGGTNSSLEKKISPVGFDYHIDDLTISTVLPNTKGRSAVATTELKFKIYEQTGFSFMRDLSTATNNINLQSEIVKNIDPKFQPGPLKQFYILGIKFTGYDINGLPVKATDPLFRDYNNGYASENSVIERYFGIVLTSVKFKLDGKMVSYDCVAAPNSEMVAYGQMNAVLKKSETLVGETIYDILMGGTENSKTQSRGLAQSLNDMNEGFKFKNIVNYPNTYKFQFLDADGKDVGKDSPIARGKIFNQATITNQSAPTANVTDSKGIPIKNSIGAVSIDKTRSQVSVNSGQSIVSVIDNIITKSTYISDSLDKISTEKTETSTKENPVTADVAWFSINPVVKVTARDQRRNDWAYEITYQIKPFSIPFIISPYVKSPIKFPGIFKDYEYWLTGKNSEIISYSQEYNSLYYQPLPVSGGKDELVNNGRDTQTPISPQGVSGDSDLRQGGQNRGSQINESVRISLHSHADNSIVKLKIMGDPDYLMSGVGVNNVGLPQYYGKGFTINPNSGQIFIRINFRSGEDYKPDGTLNILGPIKFYGADVGDIPAPEGLIYMVTEVESTFSKGLFSQSLVCVMAPESSLVIKNNSNTNGDVGRENPNKTSEYDKRNPGVIKNNFGQTGRRAQTTEEIAGIVANSTNNRSPLVTPLPLSTIKAPPAFSNPSPLKVDSIMNKATSQSVFNTNNDDQAKQQAAATVKNLFVGVDQRLTDPTLRFGNGNRNTGR